MQNDLERPSSQAVTPIPQEEPKVRRLFVGPQPTDDGDVRTPQEVERSAKHAPNFTLSEVLEYLQNTELSPVRESVIDALTLALAAERIDPILTRLRYRDQINGIIMRLADAVQCATHIASTLGVELDGSPVGPTRDFSDWDADALRKLAIATEVIAGRLRRDADQATASVEEQLQAMQSRDAEIVSLREALERSNTRVESLVEHYKQELLEARTQLGAVVDAAEFVVALVDPMSREPKEYVGETESGYRVGVPFGAAARFPDFRSAQSVRVQLIQTKRKQLRSAQKADRLGVRPMADLGASIAVMRLSHSIVTIEDI